MQTTWIFPFHKICELFFSHGGDNNCEINWKFGIYHSIQATVIAINRSSMCVLALEHYLCTPFAGLSGSRPPIQYMTLFLGTYGKYSPGAYTTVSLQEHNLL